MASPNPNPTPTPNPNPNPERNPNPNPNPNASPGACCRSACGWSSRHSTPRGRLSSRCGRCLRRCRARAHAGPRRAGPCSCRCRPPCGTGRGGCPTTATRYREMQWRCRGDIREIQWRYTPTCHEVTIWSSCCALCSSTSNIRSGKARTCNRRCWGCNRR